MTELNKKKYNLKISARRQSDKPPIAYMGTFPSKGLEARRSIFDGAQEKFKNLTPRLSEFEISKDVTLKFREWLVSS